VRRATFAFIAGASVTSACTDLLDIDDDYVVHGAASGGAGGGGSGGLAGMDGSAVVARTGGAGGAFVLDAGLPPLGIAGGAPPDARSEPEPCPDSMKRCNGSCVIPDPSVGCGLEGCALCPYPPGNAIALCAGASCAFQCAEGFALNGADLACEAMPSAGGSAAVDAGGPVLPPTGGAGGAPACNPASCPRCPPFIQECCNVFRRCGCNYVAACI
jgi:hypothetical protein